MRHGKKVNHLGRTHSHRSAMLSNMASSLIRHKRISTTLAKAKALRVYVEPLLTKSKTDSTHSRRVVFSYLQDKEAVSELFREVATKVADRPGGYTRIIKTGTRPGDQAEMCIIELVDYNELMLADKVTKKKSSRRGRRGKKATSGAAGAEATLNDQNDSDMEVVEVADESENDEAIEVESQAEEVKSEVKTEQPEASEEKKEDAAEDSKDNDAGDSEEEKKKE